jgi:endonuclease III
MAKGDYLTRPRFPGAKDQIEEKAADWLEENCGHYGEDVMRSLADLIKSVLSPRTEDAAIVAAAKALSDHVRDKSQMHITEVNLVKAVEAKYGRPVPKHGSGCVSVP